MWNNNRMSGSLLGLGPLWIIVTVILLQVGHSVEQGSRYLSPSYGALVDSRGQGSAQQVIVPGGFQQQQQQQHHHQQQQQQQQQLIQSNFAPSRSAESSNRQTFGSPRNLHPSIQNGHFQLRSPPLFPPSALQRDRSSQGGPGRIGEFTPLLPSSSSSSGSTSSGGRSFSSGSGSGTSSSSSSSSGSAQPDSRPTKDSQYEYYDETDGDVVYHYSNEDPSEASSLSQGTAAAGSRGRGSLPITNANSNSNSNNPPKKFQGFSRPGLGSNGRGSLQSQAQQQAQQQQQQQQQQQSGFIPLVDDDEPISFKGRSVRPQLSQRNSAYTSANNYNPNPTPLPSLLRNTSILAKNRNVQIPLPPQPQPQPPPSGPGPSSATALLQQSILTRRPAVIRGPVNRFTLTSRPQSQSESPFVPSPLLKSNNFVPTSIQSQLPPLPNSNSNSNANANAKQQTTPSSSDSQSQASSSKASAAPEEEYEYREEDEEGDVYYEGEEEGAKGGASKDKDKDNQLETKTKVTVSVSTKTSSTTPAPPQFTTSGPEIVISVATTKSVRDRPEDLNQLQAITTASPVTTPKVTFSRATGSSIVVASVQTSRSVATPSVGSSSKQETSSSPNPNPNSSAGQDSSKSDPEYYEEEYSYQENYPLLNSKNPTAVPSSSGPGSGQSEASSSQSSPTESIMDKLDRVQSELHNGVLAGQYNPSSGAGSGSGAQIPSSSTEAASSSNHGVSEATRGFNEKQKKSLNIISGETDGSGSGLTGGGAAGGDIISKTLNLQNFLKNIQFKEDVSAFLPPEYTSTTSKTTTAAAAAAATTEPSSTTPTTTTTTTTTAKATTATATTEETSSSTTGANADGPPPVGNSDSSIGSIQFDEIGLSALLPKGYKSAFAIAKERTTASPTSTTTEIPATSPTSTTTSTTTTTGKSSNPLESLFAKVKFSDSIAALLPPGYDPSLVTAEAPTTTSTSTSTEKIKSGLDALFANVQVDDISKFLPANFNARPETSSGGAGAGAGAGTGASVVSTTTSSTTTEKSLNKLVFPTRPGSLKATRPTTASRKIPDSPPPQTVTVQAGWPTRKTTEFTGWPTSSTEATPSTTAMTSTSTTPATSTTTTTRRPTTTPIPPKQSPVTLCGSNLCKMEAVLRIVGYRWKPEYSDINTEEWKHLERTVKRELDATYRSSKLAKYYRSVDIEGFTRGSVIVDYFVLLENVTTNLTSADVRAWFHASLPPSEQHDVPVDKDADNVVLAADERLRLGRYTIDPKYTDFKVRNVTNEVHGASASEGLIPQWGIAVIVIGLASLMFVVIFGVTVLVNRHRNSKKKNAVSLTQEMLSEFNKSHLGVDNYGADDLYNMDDVWNDKHQPPPHMDRTFDRKPGKRASSSGKGSANYNIYDSWKTEWNGHYTNGSYYGDSGYVPGRRRSDYDTNF